MDIKSIYRGKNIFITGGSGFVGKVLIEKLLRTFPDLGDIYVLIRSKKGKSPQERLETITKNVLFDKLKRINPDALKKLKAIEGDLMEPRLGISDADRKLLIDNTNIIFHGAASVRFDDPLYFAIKVNVRSTRDIVELASEVKNLAQFIHISTTYCNTDKQVIEEKLYPSHGNWRDAILLAENGDQGITDAMTQKYIQPLPNTYTYAKSLAEHVVFDLCKGKIPALIVRPSVVVSMVRNDPLRGWNDNLNGPVGLLVAGGKGLLRICYGNRDSVQDYIPVDAVSSLTIYATYLKIKNGSDCNEIEIYNNSKYKESKVTTGDMVNMGSRLIWDRPFDQVIWYPRFSMTNCFYNYYIQVLIFHMLPAFFLDIVLRIAGQKPMIFAIQRKIFIANTVLWYFIQNTWDFVNHKSTEIQAGMTPEEKAEFGFEEVIQKFNDMEAVYEYYRDSKMGVGKTIFKEKLDVQKNRKLIWRLFILDSIVRTIFISLFIWYVIYRSSFLQSIYGSIENYFAKL